MISCSKGDALQEFKATNCIEYLMIHSCVKSKTEIISASLSQGRRRGDYILWRTP